MGFHVGIDGESERLIDLVTTDPSKVLGKLYSAYMLFLVGEPDEAELKWLLNNAKALDSLTGDYIAYAVFAETFKVKLRTNWAPVDRAAKTIGKISIDELDKRHSVRRLVKDGTFGMVVDGDELTAITYGTDRVARALGILDKLPCLVVVDAVPQADICIIHLDADVTSVLMPLLRKAIARFSDDGGDKTIKNFAEQIIQLQDKIAAEHQKVDRLQRQVDRMTHKIEKLKGAIEYGRAADRPHMEGILQTRGQERQQLIEDLERLPGTLAEGIERLETDFDTVLRRYRLHQELLFSNILQKEVGSLGLQSKLTAGKTATLSFFGSLLKPDILLKLWAMVHS